MNEDVTISPYELERLQKINRNKEFLKIIGLDQPAIAVERKKKTDSDPSKKTKKRKEPSNDYLEFMERRKSQRLSTKVCFYCIFNVDLKIDCRCNLLR
jgi:hypothetical protein